MSVSSSCLVAEGGASTEFWTCCFLSTSVANVLVDGIVSIAGITFSEVVAHVVVVVVVSIVLDVLVLVEVRATNSSLASSRDDSVVVLGRSLVDTAESVAMVVGVVLVATRVDSGVDDVEDDDESHSNSREGAIGVVGGADGGWRWRTLRVGVRAVAVAAVLDVAASGSAIFTSTRGGAAAAVARAAVEAGVTGTAAVNLWEREAKGIVILGC